MENRINNVITLANGKKYFILKQAIYMNENYYIVAETTEQEDDLKENFMVLHETKKGDDNYVRIETNPEVLQVILKHLNVKED